MANWQTTLRYLNINGLRLGASSSGSSWDLNILTNPNGWAQQLDQLLNILWNATPLEGGHYKIWFQVFDTNWGAVFGLDDYNCQLYTNYNTYAVHKEPALIYQDYYNTRHPSTMGFPSYLQSVSNNPVDSGSWYKDTSLSSWAPGCWRFPLQMTNPLGADTKYFLDKLADAYVSASDPHHNFLADPRIWAWALMNECTFRSNPSDPPNALYTFTMGLNDYIHSKGGKTIINCPISSSSWGIDTASNVPLFENKVDYYELHYYGEYAKTTDQATWDNLQARNTAWLTTQRQNLGSFGTDRSFIGEWGLASPTSDLISGYISQEEVEKSYKSQLAAMVDSGWRGSSQFELYSGNLNGQQDKAGYAIIEVPSDIKRAGYNTLKEYYGGTSPTYPCPYGDATFNTQSELDAHILAVHTSPKIMFAGKNWTVRKGTWSVR